MHTYWVKYDITFEGLDGAFHMSDIVTSEYAKGAGDLQAQMSVNWALVKGCLNDITNFQVTRHVETD
jgi:hypothetical protein